MNLAAALTGFATGFSLILAIGAQNAFVLRQGLTGAHVLALVLFCSISDALLIAAGVAGFGAVTALVPWLPLAMTLAGAGFLAGYGLMRLRAAWRGGHQVEGGRAASGFWPVMGLAALFTWANPHVYLDTLALNGAVAAGFEGVAGKTSYALGATAASFTFFFGLGFGARALAPLLRSPRAWRLLDAGIGVMMLALAAALLFGLPHSQ